MWLYWVGVVRVAAVAVGWLVSLAALIVRLAVDAARHVTALPGSTAGSVPGWRSVAAQFTEPNNATASKNKICELFIGCRKICWLRFVLDAIGGGAAMGENGHRLDIVCTVGR